MKQWALAMVVGLMGGGCREMEAPAMDMGRGEDGGGATVDMATAPDLAHAPDMTDCEPERDGRWCVQLCKSKPIVEGSFFGDGGLRWGPLTCGKWFTCPGDGTYCSARSGLCVRDSTSSTCPEHVPIEGTNCGFPGVPPCDAGNGD
jgi:hypothetical protein